MGYMEAVVGTMIPFIGGGLGSIVTRKNIKTWYPVRFFCKFLSRSNTVVLFFMQD